MLSNTINSTRRVEIDFVRGIAIILMVLFHLIVDLKDIYAYNLEYLQGFWYLEGKLSAILFIIICGVSSTLGRSSTYHGIKVLLWGMLLTAVTYFYNGSYYILFGILHFLGISLLSASFMGKRPLLWLFITSLGTMIIGMLFSERFVTNPYLFPVGLITSTFSSLDYYPLFPWYGVFLFGIILGRMIYTDKKGLGFSQVPYMQLDILAPVGALKMIIWLGQHSLGIYLVHQPILLTALYIFHSF